MSVFKRVFCVLCVAVLICFSGVTAYAAGYIYLNNNEHHVTCSNGEDFMFRGYQRTPSKATIPVYLLDDGESLWLVSDVGHSDWFISAYGNGKTWQSYFTDPAVEIKSGWYGQEIKKGSSWGPFTDWGIDELYSMGIEKTEAGENAQLIYYKGIDSLGGGGSDFFRYTPIWLRGQMGMILPEILPVLKKALLIAVPCGVGLMALLIGWSKSRKALKIYLT